MASYVFFAARGSGNEYKNAGWFTAGERESRFCGVDTAAEGALRLVEQKKQKQP